MKDSGRPDDEAADAPLVGLGTKAGKGRTWDEGKIWRVRGGSNAGQLTPNGGAGRARD